jgi:hypothetical protein
MHPPLERRSLRALLLGAALGATACSDATLPPRGGAAAHPAGIRFSATASEGKPQRYPNSRKYADTGHRPATGRAGSARLSTRMLLYPSGITRMELTTGSFDGTGAASGTMNRVQLKLFGLESEHIATANFNQVSSSTLQLSSGALARRMTVQVQANIVGPDPSRTGVVTVHDTVWLGPDLRVAGLSLPANAVLGTPVNILGTVAELNGDIGARADCVLYVDGLPADRADGIWVDAGDTVTCGFTHRFAAAGTHTVRLAVENAAPAAWSTAHDNLEETVEVSPEAPDTLRFSGYAFVGHWRNGGVRRGSYRDLGEDSAWEYEWEGEVQTTGVWASVSSPIRFPLTGVTATQRSLDVLDHREYRSVEPDWTGHDPFNDATQSCFSRSEPSPAVWLYVCSNVRPDGAAWTYVAYTRSAGTVTYHSRGHARFWNGDEVEEFTWSYNGSYGSGVATPLGEEYRFQVDLEDTTGQRYSLDARVLLQDPREDVVREPWTCWADDEWWEPAWASEWCSAEEAVYWALTGSLSF